jgi:hypothetical protein
MKVEKTGAAGLHSWTHPSLTQSKAEAMRNMPNPSRSTPWPPGLVLAFLVVLLCIFSTPLAAQEDLEKPPPIPPEDATDVPIPPKVQGEQIEPTVTITEEEDRRIEEYRFNGQVYMVKITPKGGVPYYYIDTDGDGRLELDMAQQALNPVQPVYWKIKEWD